MNHFIWTANTEADIASYRVESAASSIGPWSTLATITHDLTGPNYDTVAKRFFYDDDAAVSTWYRVIAIDATRNESAPSQPWQASGVVVSAELTTLAMVKEYLNITHNSNDALLTRLIKVVSEFFSGYCGRIFAVPVPADLEQAAIEYIALKFKEAPHVGKSSQTVAGASAIFLPSLLPLSVRAVLDQYKVFHF